MNASERVRKVILVAAVVGALSQPSIAAVQCVDYGAVSLAGTLVRQTYPGEPDYESVTKGDEPRVIWILQLDERACVYSDSTHTGPYGEREVQLVLDAGQYERYRTFLGKHLVVTGQLARGGAAHEKRLVLVVNGIEKSPALRKSHSYLPSCRC